MIVRRWCAVTPLRTAVPRPGGRFTSASSAGRLIVTHFRVPRKRLSTILDAVVHLTSMSTIQLFQILIHDVSIVPMDLARCLAVALDPSLILATRGATPDPWQRDFLRCHDRQVLLCCSRQAGKSTAAAALALHTALFRAGALVLLLSPSLRQSVEIFRKVLQADDALGRPLPAASRTQLRLELGNGSRIVCLPGREQTLRGFSGVRLLVLDEAARIPDDLYRSVRPMLAVSQGRLVALSTPFGQRGWFYHEWAGGGPWKRIRITWRDCPRITPEFIDEERRALGPSWVAQEYETEFAALEGLVYPEFPAAAVASGPVPSGRPVGGIDFGWRNPFAAVWGVLDAEDVLWLTGERYATRTPLHEHAAALRAAGSVRWFADPSGASEIAALRAAGLDVRGGDNDVRPGIAAVSARLQTGRLRVLRTACPNLLREASLYRYPTAAEQLRDGENPVDEHNHALAALRYLVCGLDTRFLARLRRRPAGDSPAAPPIPDDDRLWTRLT
jgi:hypothetical protein